MVLIESTMFQGEKRQDKTFAGGTLKGSKEDKVWCPRSQRAQSDCLTVIIEHNLTGRKISISRWSPTGDMKKTISLSTSRMVTGADMDAKSDCSCLAWKTSTPERSGIVLSRWASIPASPRSRWIMWRSRSGTSSPGQKWSRKSPSCSTN